MTREELFAALEIEPPKAEPAGVGFWLDGQPGTAGAAQAPPSPTALELDEWSRRRGKELVEGDVLGPVLAPLYEEMPQCVSDLSAAADAAADFHAAAFEPEPKLADRCTDQLRHDYMTQLLETEEYQALHADTQLDPLAAELAAGHLAQGWVKLAQESPQEPPQGDGGQSGPQSFKQQMATLRAASRATAAAQQTVDQLHDVQAAMGGGQGSGQGAGGGLDPGQLREHLTRLQHNGRFARIMQLAGRYRRAAQAAQRRRTVHGRDDVVGVELAGDIVRLVPSELAQLADPDLETLAFRRLIEAGALCREHRGAEPQDRGPIVVCVDESGSMEGDPIAQAKAFALAMAWIARHQRRALCLIGFGTADEFRVLPILGNQWGYATTQEDLYNWLGSMFGGGTSPHVPLEFVPENWGSLWPSPPAGKADLITITDAAMGVPPSMVESFNHFRQTADVRHYVMAIGCEPGDFVKVADRTWSVADLTLEQDAIQEMLAI